LLGKGEIYLIDFGFARYLQPQTGVLLPADPGFEYDEEQFNKYIQLGCQKNPGIITYRLLRKEISERSDLFGVGVVAIDLFTNWVEDEDLFNQPWDRVLPLTTRFADFIHRLLSRDENSFRNVQEALDELKNII